MKKTPITITCNCNGCPLYNNYEGIRGFIYGNKKPEVFVIVEAPSSKEWEQGEPLVGNSKAFLDTMLKNAGITSYALDSCVKCRPVDKKGKNRTPTEKELQLCLPHLKQAIEKVQPKVLILTGKTAAGYLLNKKGKLDNLRGWHEVTINGWKTNAIVTFNPGVLHYEPDKQSVIQADLYKVQRFLAGEADATFRYQWKYLDTLPKLKEAIKNTLKWKLIGFDFETPSLAKFNVEPTTLAWGTIIKGKPCVYALPFIHPQTPWQPQHFTEVKRLLTLLWSKLATKKEVTLTAHNAKFDQNIFFDYLNLWLTNCICTIQFAHLIEETRLGGGRKGSFSLEKLTEDWLHFSGDEIWDDRTSSLIYGGEIGKADIQKVSDHNAKDVAVQLYLFDEIKKRATHDNYDVTRFWPFLQRVPHLISVTERNGMPVNLQHISSLRQDSGPILARQEEILQNLEGRHTVQQALKKIQQGDLNFSPLFSEQAISLKGFEPSKPAQCMTLFLDVLKLDWGLLESEQTPTGKPRLDKDFYATFSEIEECSLVNEWKSLDKLRSSYLEKWWTFANQSHDFRIRTNYHYAGTVTGRLSSSDPPLQVIPNGKTEAAKIIKRIIGVNNTDKNHLRVLVSADLSQAEIRWLAEISNEQNLKELFKKRQELLHQYAKHANSKLWTLINEAYDLHRSTAANMYDVPVETVTKIQRSEGKQLNFAVIYGLSDFSLGTKLKIETEEAREKIDLWYNAYPNAAGWLQDIEAFACKHGWVETPMGRRRHLPALLLNKEKAKHFGRCLRIARNSPVQGVASDMNLWIAVKVQDYITLHQKNWLLTAYIHDAIVAEIDLEDTLEFTQVITNLTEDAQLLQEFGIAHIDCPMEGEVKVGFNYGDLITLKPNKLEQEQVVEHLLQNFKGEKF